MPKNKKIFEDEFYKMQKIYSDIFKYFFPAKNCTGFVERNLSVAFSKAYELCHSGDICFPWFEFAFGKESKTHIDCCIVNISKKEILLIESKRFNNVNEKIREVHSDIERLISLGNNIDEECRERLNDISEYSVYSVILADVWCENDTKNQIFTEFCEGNFNCGNITDKFEYYTNGFENETSGIYKWTKTLKNGKTNLINYKLLGLSWKIR